MLTPENTIQIAQIGNPANRARIAQGDLGACQVQGESNKVSQGPVPANCKRVSQTSRETQNRIFRAVPPLGTGVYVFGHSRSTTHL